jgi:hypothetical protein
MGGARIKRAAKGTRRAGHAATGKPTDACPSWRLPMRSIRWLPAFLLSLAVVCGTATAALAGPAAPVQHAAARCTTSAPQGTCGPYHYRQITKSDGFNTYVANNKWGCGNPDQCGLQTVRARTPGDWQVTSNQATGNTAVLTYPDVQQLFTRTSGKNPPLATFSKINSHFAEAMHANAKTDAEAAYDIWLSATSGPNEVMVWVDNHGRGSGGARRVGRATISGQRFTVYEYGTGEIIFSLNHNEHVGTVHILTTLRWLQHHKFVSKGARIGQVDFGWEICSTGHRPETFTISKYTLRSK